MAAIWIGGRSFIFSNYSDIPQPCCDITQYSVGFIALYEAQVRIQSRKLFSEMSPSSSQCPHFEQWTCTWKSSATPPTRSLIYCGSQNSTEYRWSRSLIDDCFSSIMIFTTQSSTLHCLEPELQNCICASYKNLFYLLKCSGCLKTMISRIRTGMLCRLVKRRCTRLGTIVCHKLSDLSFVKRGPDAKFIPLPLFSGLSLWDNMQFTKLWSFRPLLHTIFTIWRRFHALQIFMVAWIC